MRKKLQNGFWPALLALQVAVLLALIWLRPAELMIDNDAAKCYFHIMEMWKNGTAVIPDWYSITTLELDCASLLALPLYGLTGNILLSFQLADTLLVPAAALLLLWLMRRLGQDRDTCCIGTLLVMLPYSFGILEYWNMMFLNCAQYYFKVLLPLALIALLLPVNGKRPWGHWAGAAAALALMAVVGFSSGSYMLLCGLFPVLCWRVWLWWDQKERPDLFSVLLWVGTLAASGGGMLLGRLMGASNRGDGTVLAAATSLAENVLNCLTGLFNLFGAVGKFEVSALSLEGIDRLLRVLFVLCLLAALVWAARRMLCRETSGMGYLTAIALWNLLILCIANTSYGQYFEYRYHLIGMVPVLLLFAIALPQLRASIRTAALLGVLVVTVMVDWGAVRATAPAVLGDSSKREAATVQAFLAAMEKVEVPYRDVYVWSSGIAEICRIMDPAHNYATYVAERNALQVHDSYYTDRDVLGHTGPFIYVQEASVTPPGDCEALGQFLPGWDYTFWYAAESCIDGVSGFPGGDAMMDYPDSPNYIIRGEIDAERRLHAVGLPDGEWVLNSAQLVLHTVTDITVDYQLDDPAAGPMVFQLWQDGNCLVQLDMDGSSPTFSLSGTAPGTYTVRLVLPEGAGATVSSFLFTPSGR